MTNLSLSNRIMNALNASGSTLTEVTHALFPRYEIKGRGKLSRDVQSALKALYRIGKVECEKHGTKILWRKV